MFYYLYEIKNKLNGKIYVGVHKTNDMDDGYMGSGKIIKRAIEKHGIDNFTKVILETFENAEDMYAREKEVVTDEFLLREDVYNLRRGGSGGWDYINSNGLSDRTGVKLTDQQRKNISSGRKEKITYSYREKISKRMIGNKNALGNRGGTPGPRSDEIKAKISAAAKKNTHIYERVECPHCGKIGAKNLMKHWHFDNCRYKIDNM